MTEEFGTFAPPPLGAGLPSFSLSLAAARAWASSIVIFGTGALRASATWRRFCVRPSINLCKRVQILRLTIKYFMASISEDKVFAFNYKS